MGRGKLTHLELLLEEVKTDAALSNCASHPERAEPSGLLDGLRGAGATDDSWGARRHVAGAEGMMRGVGGEVRGWEVCAGG